MSKVYGKWAAYGLIFLMMILPSGCTPSIEESVSIYQQEHSLYYSVGGNEHVLLDGIVDYELTSLEEGKQHLIVIHQERSDHVDEASYEEGISRGLDIGGWLRIYELELTDDSLLINEIYESDFTRVNPWLVEAGHLDENGQLDVFVGAFRATDYYETDKRPFLMEWSDTDLTRKWTGSFIGDPEFAYARFEDHDGDGIDELMLCQPDQDGHWKHNYYRFGYFSFDLIGEVDHDDEL